MKEFSIEEKAQRYDEALERASKLRVQNPFDTVSQMMEHIFPELAESNDEKIRRDIVELIKETHVTERYYDLNKMLAWLEKQSEKPQEKPTLEAVKEGKKIDNANKIALKDYNTIDPHFGKPVDFKAEHFYVSKVDGKIHDMTYNPANKVEPKFKVGDVVTNKKSKDTVKIVQILHDSYCYSGWDGAATVHSDFSISEQDDWELVEQKPAEWSDEDEEALDMCIDAIPKAWKTKSGILLTKWLKKHFYQQPKQKWDEKDSEIMDELIYELNQRPFLCSPYIVKFTDWLKSLKDRVQPQPKQEWSKEDENRTKKVMHILSLDGRISNTELQSIYDWLKSLKPQSQWKPSKEQIEALEHSLGDYNIKIFEDRYEILKSLYNDLKKLKE